MKKILALLILSALAGCGSNDQGKTTNNTTKSTPMVASVRLNWIASCSFTGEVLGAKEFAKINNLSLKIETGGPGLDPIKLVQSGSNTFGVAGSDLVLAANDKGADLVIVGLVSYNSPGVWLAKEEKNIKSIEDVKGKRIGELPGGNMQYLYEVFLKKTGLVRNRDFKPVPIPFELKNFIIQDECDLRPVFIYDETSELELNNIRFTLLEPRNFGIQFKGMSYFCKRETLTKDPQLVQAFINTMARGWEETLKNPEKAIQYLKDFDNSIREKKELIGLKKGLEYFRGYKNMVLYTDLNSWDVMATDMKELGFLKSQPDIKKVVDMSFVNNYYNKK